jgi:hypothetical protein
MYADHHFRMQASKFRLGGLMASNRQLVKFRNSGLKAGNITALTLSLVTWQLSIWLLLTVC